MSLDTALALIESVKERKALFIGETIIDEYRFVSPLWRPSKENILAVRELRRESYRGGIIAACMHAGSFCETAVMSVGNKIVKARYVDENYNRKLFEVQQIEDGEPSASMPAHILARHDMLAVHDYGHGMMSAALIAQLCGVGKFLAVGAQTNAANMGFNFITRYPRADYIVIDEPEARLAAAEKDAPLEVVMRKLAAGRCKRLVVTHGRHGAYGLDDGTFSHAPTFSSVPLDTMGAGDAFFAVTAPMAEAGSMADLLMIGNAAGALKTQIVGHRESVTKDALIAFLKANHG